MATGSLVLKISADLTSFSRQLNKMTRDVREAADSLSDVGKSMTLGITVPVTLAGAALLKMAAENEEAAARMQRSFGPAVQQVQARLDALSRTMPVAGTELQNMATRLNDVAQELGFAAPAAAKLSTSVLAMANDLSAYAAVPAEEAVQALTAAMQGQTRGLKALGITIGEAEVKQHAYRLGIAKTGEALTPAGQALATYAALLERSKTFTGEAARRQQDLGRQLGLVKRDLAEVADRLATRLIPTFRSLAGMLRVVVDWVAQVPTGFWVMIGAAAAFAAAIGPVAIAVAQLTKAFVLLQAAIQIISGAAGIVGLIGKLRALATNPAVLALIAIAVAAGAAYMAYRRFRGEVEKSGEDLEDSADGLASLQDLLNGIGATAAQAGDAVQRLQQRAQQLERAVTQQIEIGGGAAGAANELLSIQQQALNLYDRQNDKLSDQAIILQGIVLQVARVRDLQRVTSALQAPRVGAPNMGAVNAAIGGAAEPRGITAMRVAGEVLQRENQLRTREVAMQMIQVFPAVRLAAVQLKESFVQAAQDFDLARETLMQSWQGSNIGQGLASGIKAAVTPMMQSFTPAAIAAAALGRVLEGLRPVFDALSPPLVMLGRIIGSMITPYLRILFPVLKVFGEVAAFLGEILARVSAGIATGVGRLLVGIGKLLNLLPGSIGNPIIRAGRALLGFADDQYQAANELRRARREIRAMQWGETTDNVAALGDAARDTAEALLNVPSGFRIALERFRAQIPFTPTGPGVIPPTGGTTGGGAVPGTGTGTPGGPIESAPPPPQIVVPLIVDGKMIARAILSPLQRAAQQQFGSSTDWPLVQSL